MKFNSSSTDIINDIRKTSMPFRVYFDNKLFLLVNDFHPHCQKWSSRVEKDETIESRFEILDIRLKRNYGVTSEQIMNYYRKKREEFDSPWIWEDKEEQKFVISDDGITEMMEREFEKSCEEAMAGFANRQFINDRFEILDIR